MWTASEKIGTSEEARDLAAFLADKPGKTSVAAHKLDGDRFTAVGRFNVDVEYYIAQPSDTERWTMRWGQKYVDYGVQGEDYRDLLQLRLDGDGEYFVVMFPRFREEAPPQFATLGDGSVIRITGGFGTDYCFLPGNLAEVSFGEVHFRGEAGSIQDRADTKLLATGAAGEARFGEWGIAAPQAASLRVEPGRVVVRLPYGHKDGGEVTLRTSGQWEPVAVKGGVTLTPVEGGCRVVLAPGVVEVVLSRGTSVIDASSNRSGWSGPLRIGPTSGSPDLPIHISYASLMLGGAGSS